MSKSTKSGICKMTTVERRNHSDSQRKKVRNELIRKKQNVKVSNDSTKSLFPHTHEGINPEL